MEKENFQCHMCMFSTNYFVEFKNHYVRQHKNDPNFFVACCVDRCEYSTKKWGAFRVHVHRKHSTFVQAGNRIIPVEANADVMDTCDKKFFNANFSLKLESQQNVTASALDFIISSASDLVNGHMECYKAVVKSKLESLNIDCRVIDDIPCETFLDGFNSSKKRHKFYRKTFSSYLMPEEVVLGSKFKTVKGQLREIHRKAYIIPFQENVKNLLTLPEVWYNVQHPHYSQSEFMFDICDGAYVRNHDFYKQNPTALQFIVNCDDLEITNPLGSHIKKHKLSMFYWTLANIPPQHRSRLNVIQLLAIGKTIDVRQPNALDKILCNFVKDVNTFSQEGIPMDIHGENHIIKGRLLLAPCDTLGANWLGQFKEGVSFALKSCRRCNMESLLMSQATTDSKCILRTMESHIERCTLLKTLSHNAHAYWSKIWGINGSSCLMSIKDFELITALVQDPMHVLLEGIVKEELSDVLFNFVFVKKYFTLKWFNTALNGFPYSYLHEKSKPERIEKQTVAGIITIKIKQTASATWTLYQLLPYIIGNKVPENNKNWVNTLKLLQICIFALSPYCSRETSYSLRILVHEYLSERKILYPKRPFLPKMHYMLHLPEQMLLYGPTRHHWCMRFEGKHSYFTQTNYKNFKNLPYSLSRNHQLHMCHAQSTGNGEVSTNFLYQGDIIKEGNNISLSDMYPNLIQPYVTLTDVVYSSKDITIHGLQYKPGCVILFDYTDNIEEVPIFVIVRNIVIAALVKYFIVEELTAHFNPHILSYIIKETGRLKVISYNDFKFKWPLSVYAFEGNMAVMNVNSHTCEIV